MKQTNSETERVGALPASLLAKYRPGWTLPREFFRDEEIYRSEIDTIWRRSWLFAGHTAQIPKLGDYFTLELDTDSIIVIHGEDGQYRAMHNVCRHRGTILCAEESGHAHRIVCPYHQWIYGTDGKLLSCRGMQEDLDKSQFSLHPVHLREVEGLLWVNFSDTPTDFEPAREIFGHMAKPQGLRRAKVAKMVDYTIKANWKLVWENNRECFHCNVNHPQYIKANFDHYNADDANEKIRAQIQTQVERSERKWERAGLAVSHKKTGMTLFPDAERDIWYSANRTALVDGWVSETMDGRQVAPLMGDYKDADVGTLRMRALPNFWNHSSCDHGVTTLLLPMGIHQTKARVIWLVDEAAEEGRDYKLSELMPFWQLTSEQDWVICDQAQRGVNSTAYTPGPYSVYKEYNVDGFIRWYLQKMKAGKI